MTTVEKLGKIGPYHADIQGDATNGGVRGPFKIVEVRMGKVPTYPSLWSHDAVRERTMAFDASEEAVSRVPMNADEKTVIDRKVTEVWASASHLHFNRDFRFNRQSTAVQFTQRLSLGGRAWLSIKIGPVDREKVATLWGNCSLGLLSYWYFANKQHAGRGSIGKNQLATLPFLDVTALTPAQITAGVEVFDDMLALDLQPLHDLANDVNRHELDRRFLTECLGFDPAFVAAGGPLDLLRQKLAAEPSIRGGKA